MRKIIIAPDSFKGAMSAIEVCEIIGEEAKKAFPEAEIIRIPIADGGEGTVDAFLSIFGGEKVFAKVQSPLGRTIEAFFGLLPGKTAVIETAQASGLTIEAKNDALSASTFGTGELIRRALDEGAKRIILGLGGSATTDGGAGAVQALGGRFLNKSGNEIPRGGKGLLNLREIDLSDLDERLNKIDFTVLCDVKNPLFGKNGAAYVYAPQKGASEEDVKLLDEGLRNLAEKAEALLTRDFSKIEDADTVENTLNNTSLKKYYHETPGAGAAENSLNYFSLKKKNYHKIPGAGAAGGLGFSCIAFLGGKLVSGIDCVLDAANFEEEAETADLVITGEGKMDAQSLMGKVPFGVAKRANGAKVIAFVGLSLAEKRLAEKLGISEIFETDPLHRPFEEVRPHAKEDLRKTAETVFKTKFKGESI